jgi:TRAP-type C4-dicarboxylate transport system permease small subunit
MQRSRGVLRVIDDALARIEDLFIIIAHGIVAGLVLLAVVLRYVFNDPLIWGEELIVGLFTWMVFIGAAAAVRSRTHIRIDVMAAVFRHPKMGWLNTVTLLLGITIVAVAIVACWDQVQQEVGVELPMLGVSKAWFAASMPAGLVLMLVHVMRLWADEGAAPVFRGETETLVEQAGGRRES